MCPAHIAREMSRPQLCGDARGCALQLHARQAAPLVTPLAFARDHTVAWPLPLSLNQRQPSNSPARAKVLEGIDMKHVAIAVGLVLSVIAGTGMGQAHDKYRGPPSTQPRTAVDSHETRATLTALAERLADAQATVSERVEAAKARQKRLAALIAESPALVLRHAIAAK